MGPGELNPDLDFGLLSVNGVACFAPNRAITDMSAALDDAELRGGDRLVPRSVGTLPRRRRRTVTRKDFPMVFTGAYTTGGAYVGGLSARKKALLQGIEAFRAAIGIGEDAPAGTTGAVTATWDRTSIGLDVLTAQVHVLSPFRFQLQIGGVATATLSLSFPYGEFA